MKQKKPKHNIVGNYNGIPVALLSVSKHFWAIGAYDKLGGSIEAPSFHLLAKKLDKLGLRTNEVDTKLAGTSVAIVSRYSKGIDGVGTTTGRTRTRWIQGYGSRRARGIFEAEVRVRGAPGTSWSDIDLLRKVSHKVAHLLMKASKRAEKATNFAEKLERDHWKHVGSLPRLTSDKATR